MFLSSTREAGALWSNSNVYAPASFYNEKDIFDVWFCMKFHPAAQIGGPRILESRQQVTEHDLRSIFEISVRR
jgi:hypothetical protein